MFFTGYLNMRNRKNLKKIVGKWHHDIKKDMIILKMNIIKLMNFNISMIYHFLILFHLFVTIIKLFYYFSFDSILLLFIILDNIILFPLSLSALI